MQDGFSSYPQPRRTMAGRLGLERNTNYHPVACSTLLLRSAKLFKTNLCRSIASHHCSPCPSDEPSLQSATVDRIDDRRRAWLALGTPARNAGQWRDAVAFCSSGRDVSIVSLTDYRGGSLGVAQRATLRHNLGRLGTTPASGPPARSGNGNHLHVATPVIPSHRGEP